MTHAPSANAYRFAVARRDLLRLAAFTLAYTLCVLIGRLFVVTPNAPAVFWPATGLLTAALLIAGARLRLMLVALAALVQLALGYAAGIPPLSALGFVAAAALTAGLVCWIVAHLLGSYGDTRTVPQVLTLTGLVFAVTATVGLLGAALAAATFGVPYWNAWLTWWLADSVSIILVVPPVVACASLRAALPSPRVLAEALLLGVSLLAASLLVFGTAGSSTGLVALRSYVAFPFFIWAVVRFGIPGGTSAVLAASLIALWHTSRGTGPFMLLETSVERGILGAYAFCIVSAVSVLALGTILNERRRTETALRAGEAALRDSQERLRLALDAGGMGTWNWDFASDAIVWSEHHATLFGMRFADFDGRYETFARRVHPDDLAGLVERVNQAIAERSFYHHEYRVVWPDGSVRWISARGRTFENAAGEPVRMAGTVMDITARRAAQERERALLAERTRLLERLQLVLESMPIGCIIYDDAFLISFWNPAAERIFGYSAAEMLGRTPAGLLVTPQGWQQAAEVNRSNRAGERVGGITTLTAKDGRAVICEWQRTPLHDADGTFVGSLSMIQDVTARTQAEQEIQRLNADLEQRVVQRTLALETANRDLESFSYSVSHDLRAPLRHIDGFLRLLTKREADRLDPTSGRYLQVIAESSRRMGMLIDDLLHLSRVGRTEIQPQPVVLTDLVRSVIEEVNAAAEGRTLEWQVGPLPTVHADPRLLRIALVNLLSNAAKYTATRAMPRICIGALPGDAPDATFFVRDNGVGFDMQYVDKLFGVFQRLHRDDEFEGTGIGLATVHRIITRHGGYVRAEGEVDRGATFFVTLPRAKEEHP
jgi:PAS domain S-box-containing protein